MSDSCSPVLGHSSGHHPASKRLLVLPFLLIALASVVVRIWGCFAPLWFDEIFGMIHAEEMHRLADVFFTQHNDNKHHLMALWLWPLGLDRPYFFYRIPSLIAGLAMPPLVYFAARPRHGAMVAALAAFFCLTSYQIIDLSCEARGYALAMAFAAGAWICCGRFLRDGRASMAAMFAVCCLLGFLSHLTFLYAYVGFVLWSVWELPRENRAVWWYRFLILHGPIAMALFWLWRSDLRYFNYIGGPQLTLYELFADYVRDTFNIPDGWENTLGIAILAMVLIGLISLIRRGRGDGPLYVGVILAVVWAINHRIRANFAERYILLAAPFLMVPLAQVFEDVGRVGYMRAVVLLAAMVFGVAGVWQGAAVFCGGQPGYPEAVRYMSDHSMEGPRVVVCGTDDYVNGLTLAYYCRRGGDQSSWPAIAPAQWWVMTPLPEVPKIVRAPYTYHLCKTYPNRGVGAGWSLYELDAAH